MKSRLLRKIAKSQKYQILSEIKRSQGLSVSELCDRIKLSYMGVKQHCVALEKDGYLDTWRRPKGMGRPEKAYRLTDSAQEFFPTEYTHFTLEILETVAKVYGEAAPEKILYQIYQDYAKQLQPQVHGASMEEKCRSLAQLRDSLGYMSEHSVDPTTGKNKISEFNSPLHGVAERFKVVYQLEKEMFEKLLGAKVDRQMEKTGGLYKCVFTVS